MVEQSHKHQSDHDKCTEDKGSHNENFSVEEDKCDQEGL